MGIEAIAEAVEAAEVVAEVAAAVIINVVVVAVMAAVMEVMAVDMLEDQEAVKIGRPWASRSNNLRVTETKDNPSSSKVRDGVSKDRNSSLISNRRLYINISSSNKYRNNNRSNNRNSNHNNNPNNNRNNNPNNSRHRNSNLNPLGLHLVREEPCDLREVPLEAKHQVAEVCAINVHCRTLSVHGHRTRKSPSKEKREHQLC